MFGLGNYDVNVLLIALERQGYKASYFDTRKPIEELEIANPQVIGLICNVAGMFTRHWLAIRREGAIFYNLDSKRASPLPFEKQEQLFHFLSHLIEKETPTILLIEKNDQSIL